MRIKRIEIIGFKSFCDRTVLSFSDPITGIVGPNGCGKSNIVDAIRWCMGEQSAKHLRGQAMGDVIFAGSDSRGPAGMAEVALTFEDIGFSHETLQLALDREEELAALPDEDEEEKDEEEKDAGEGDSEQEGEVQDQVQDQVEAGEATREAQKVLEDKPPAIDFSAYSEVTISRRLFRDGTSGYFLNKTPCRLRDITDFFLGTGVGTKAYSIIEQGRIGMIVSARAADRRHIIEEAAGITKFKTKKRAAERKLEQTRQNLLRVSDIVTELYKRLGSLKRQAQKAARYRRYKSEVKDIEMWTASHKLLEYVAEEQTLQTALADTSARLDLARTEFNTRESAVVAERADLAVEERRLASLQEQIYELENRITLSENKIEFQRREADELDSRVATARGEIRSLTDQKQLTGEHLETHKSELTELADNMGQVEAAASEKDLEFSRAREELSTAQRQLDEARAELAAARADLARSDSQGEAVGRQREASARRLDRVVEETGTANERLASLERQMARDSERLAQLRQTRLDLGTRVEDLERKRVELTDLVQTRESEVEALRDELHRRRSRLQSLEEIHARYEGFQRGTREVMQNPDDVVDEQAGKQIRGLVAEVLNPPEHLEVAVEAALGDRIGGILVDSPEIGLRAVEYLKQRSAGRSAFVPFAVPAAIPVEDRSGADYQMMAGAEGVVGPMVELVPAETGFEEVAQTLLGDAVIVDSLERAIQLHGAGVAKRLVTLDGDIVDSRGVVYGGSTDTEGASVLSQKREIRELQEIVESLERDLTEATARYVSTKSELSQTGKAVEGLKSQTHDGELEITAVERDAEGARAELDRLRERVSRLNAEQLELEETLRNLAVEDRQMRELSESAADRIDRYEKLQLSLIEGVTEGRGKVEEMSQEVTEAKVMIAQLGEKRASLEADTLRLEGASRELKARIDKLEAGIAEHTERAETLRTEATELDRALVGMREERAGLAEKLTDGRSDYERRFAELQVHEVEARKLRQEAEQLSGDATQLEMKLTNLAVNLQHLEEGIEERYRVSLRREAGDYHLRPLVGKDQRDRLKELKRLIDRMGTDINLTAIEEFEQISERHEFLSTQRDDLENAVRQLERAISKINRTSRRLFRETFDAINDRFQTCFPRLFRGGRAKLALTGGDDVDVLEAGVEIMAQPPGKKNTTVEQLSGGEKALTAVALLFAIFAYKPSPFCLLDEVDAPLDDVNVDRYNEILREMTDRSQFIVITHNKRTMEIADRLYGVTMQEPGVSKLVTVNLSKLDDAA